MQIRVLDGWFSSVGGRNFIPPQPRPKPRGGDAQVVVRRGKEKAPGAVVVLMTIATYFGLRHHGASPLVEVQREVSSPGAVAQRGNRYLYGMG